MTHPNHQPTPEHQPAPTNTIETRPDNSFHPLIDDIDTFDTAPDAWLEHFGTGNTTADIAAFEQHHLASTTDPASFWTNPRIREHLTKESITQIICIYMPESGDYHFFSQPNPSPETNTATHADLAWAAYQHHLPEATLDDFTNAYLGSYPGTDEFLHHHPTPDGPILCIPDPPLNHYYQQETTHDRAKQP